MAAATSHARPPIRAALALLDTPAPNHAMKRAVVIPDWAQKEPTPHQRAAIQARISGLIQKTVAVPAADVEEAQRNQLNILHLTAMYKKEYQVRIQPGFQIVEAYFK